MRWRPGEAGRASRTSARDNTEARAIFFFASVDGPSVTTTAASASSRSCSKAAFAGPGREIPRLLAAMRDAPGFCLDSVSQVRMDDWSADRVALGGDAGNCLSPLSGQGTSLALAGLMCWPVRCRPPAVTTVSPSPLTSAGCGTSWLVNRRSRSGTPSVHPADSPADLPAEPGHQDTALPPRQEARPRPGHQTLRRTRTNETGRIKLLSHRIWSEPPGSPAVSH